MLELHKDHDVQLMRQLLYRMSCLFLAIFKSKLDSKALESFSSIPFPAFPAFLFQLSKSSWEVLYSFSELFPNRVNFLLQVLLVLNSIKGGNCYTSVFSFEVTFA